MKSKWGISSYLSSCGEFKTFFTSENTKGITFACEMRAAATIAFRSSMNLTAQQVPAKALPCKVPCDGLSLADWHVSICFVNFCMGPGFTRLKR